MFTKKHFINTISVLFLFAINIIFLFEHSHSESSSFSAYLWLYIPLFFAVIWFADKILRHNGIIVRKNFILLFALIILFFVASEFLFNVNKGNAYLATGIWLTNISNGTFPYNYANLFNLPFLYYVEAPFYLLGNVSLFGFFGLALFLFFVLEFSSTKKETAIRTIVLFTLPVFYYEILSCGDSFANAALVIAIIFLMKKFIDENKIDIKFFFLSVVFGAFLCTRVLLIIPFVLSLLYFFRYNIKDMVLFALLSFLIGFAFLVPFLRWNYLSFVNLGPFTNSLAHLSVWMYILLFIIVVYIGWMISDLQELLFASGIILFFVSLIIYLGDGNYPDGIILSIPFLILSIKEYEVDKFLGKKITIE